MNPDLIATFTDASADLAEAFGAEAVHFQSGTGEEVSARVVLDTNAVPVGEFGERMEYQTTLEIPAASGAVVGDAFTVAGTLTPNEGTWKAVQLLSDDGTFRKFVVQKS
ncbi:MAG: hypothetical protein H6974_09405 [Gammaproteobacteria bacterium]|nr:hypothetical protein [Gammaproteobacteria bacterium]